MGSENSNRNGQNAVDVTYSYNETYEKFNDCKNNTRPYCTRG